MRTFGILSGLSKKKAGTRPLLVQEQPGFHLGIAPDLSATSRHAASIVKDKYEVWLDGEASNVGSGFKRDYFTVAVGGGNTVKSEYKALLRYHADDINWLDHVRFFFLEESCNEKGWESAQEGLVSNFLGP